VTFLTPIALFGLLAAAIPILLHIFNLRKLKTIEFSTLSFLKELQKTKIHRLKIKQLLLLVLRTLLIILIVLAFSRPTLKGSIPGGLTEQARTTAVILFDDSQSMTASDEQGDLLRQAKNSAIAIINLMKERDEVYFVKLSDVSLDGTSEIPPGQKDFSALRSAIDDIKPSFIRRTLEDGVRYSARLIVSSKNFNKEVYLISDFQSGSLESAVDMSKTGEQLFPPNTQFFLVSIGNREQHNIALESVDISNTIFEINKPLSVKVKLTNHSQTDAQNHLVSIYQDGSRVAQKGVDIHTGQSIETEFSLVPKHSGFLEGIVELEDDDLEFDNKRCFIVYIPEELRVLLIGDATDLTYLRLALTTRLSDSSASLKINETTWNRFSSLQLSSTNVAVLANPRELTMSQSAALKSYLQNGGGILIFPGSQSTVTSFNSSVSAILGSPLNVAVESQSPTSQSSNSFLEFDKVDFRHPLFSGMFEENEKKSSDLGRNGRELESPHVKMSLHFLPTSHSKVIITLTNGSPFLMEEQSGNGRVLMMSVPANTEWSDLPLKGLFVPLTHRALAYLAQEPTANRSLLVGEGKNIPLRNPIPPKLIIKKPDGMDAIVSTQKLVANKAVHFSDTDIPGFYITTAGSLVIDKFAINLDPKESIIAPADENRRENMLKRLGVMRNAIHPVDQSQAIQRTITESRLGSELWKQFLILAIIIAVIEMFIARDTKRSLVLSTKNIESR
jgi:hypothetical protein